MNLTIAVLSWGAHKTLQNTLQSYNLFGLDKLATQKVIFFQEISDTDVKIARKFGYEYIGSPNNIGIAAAYQKLVDYATSDLFLFLENDWVLIEPAADEIIKGSHILEHGIAEVIRYRHRKHPGHPLWTLQFKGREWERPTHLLDAVHWTETPENFEGIDKGYYDYYYASAANANWTNNPTMFNTWFLRDIVVPEMGNGDVERDIQSWWETEEFIVAQGNGLFTHRRLD